MERLYFTDDDGVFLERLGSELKSAFKKGQSIAVKLHMGEKANPNHFKPEFVAKVVGVLKGAGMKPFLFDSPVMYDSERKTVEGYMKQCEEIGFTEKVVGCPVVVSNEFINVNGERMAYQVCRHLADADGVLVLTHFKGHVCSGVGGSIKNLGMGALTSRSKSAIHEGSMPVLLGKCALCKRCQQVCPAKCITYPEADANGPCFNYDSCYGCSKCVQNCPQKCLKPRVAEFDTLLADGAAAALRAFRKAYFVNVLRGLSDMCDCAQQRVRIIVPDIGMLMGRDIVAIDAASLDLTNRKAGRKVFDQVHNKDSARHIREAERLGMGRMGYEIVKI